jgi:GNAT superfamily N-acetyltransferase
MYGLSSAGYCKVSEITLRCQIRADDRSAIERITASSGYFTEKEVRLALSVFDEAIASPECSYRYLLAEMDDRVVGYACWGKDEQSDSSYELYWIAVDEACRAHGIGKRLLHAVEESIHRLSPGGQLFIETSGREQYYPTRNFYERLGYIKAAWLDDYFSPGDARVIYSKRL